MEGAGTLFNVCKQHMTITLETKILFNDLTVILDGEWTYNRESYMTWHFPLRLRPRSLIVLSFQS